VGSKPVRELERENMVAALKRNTLFIILFLFKNILK
jgi:hypothetical protein